MPRSAREAAAPLITDGGLETCLIFDHGLDLPCFAAFVLLAEDEGAETLRAYFEPYLALAHAHGAGFVLDTPTWRASREWGERLGYTAADLESVNRRSVELMDEIRRAHEDERTPVVVTGVVGPRGDGYRPQTALHPAEAERYHTAQIETLADAGAAIVAGVTMTHADEAIGIVRAARAAGVPSAVSFTVETDGRLPDGTALGAAIERVDAETDGAAAYFMVNCAHPTHIAPALTGRGGEWVERIRGVRANASAKSHAELDGAARLDTGDPDALAADLAELLELLPAATILGGCCGTDERHIAAICTTCL